MPYCAKLDGGGWWAVSGDGRSRMGPVPTRKLAEELVEELDAIETNLAAGKDGKPESMVAVCLLLAGGAVAAGMFLGFIGAVSYLTFRWITGV